MPKKFKRPCRQKNCPRLTDRASGFCEVHERQASKTYDKFIRREHNSRYGYQWRKLRARFLLSNPFCEMCKRQGRFIEATEVHHIKPLSEGGTNGFENLMALCKSCHSRITLTAENWRR